MKQTIIKVKFKEMTIRQIAEIYDGILYDSTKKNYFFSMSVDIVCDI